MGTVTQICLSGFSVSSLLWLLHATCIDGMTWLNASFTSNSAGSVQIDKLKGSLLPPYLRARSNEDKRARTIKASPLPTGLYELGNGLQKIVNPSTTVLALF